MASYRAHYITRHVLSPDSIATTAQVLDFSFCVAQPFPGTWAEIVDSVQIALGALMCLLVAVHFVKESLQMYRATKRFQLSHYTNHLVREGMLYFLMYVHPSMSSSMQLS